MDCRSTFGLLIDKFVFVVALMTYATAVPYSLDDIKCVRRINRLSASGLNLSPSLASAMTWWV
ncbi:hypothetical protein [Vibrio maerlii]|uniref:hypothetical protein n=1 Tax=Vibrio maerlii TaxID=2231648 RepID=UPI0013DF2BE4|nr:hypothetical protein [Vibrio maerlii]